MQYFWCLCILIITPSQVQVENFPLVVSCHYSESFELFQIFKLGILVCITLTLLRQSFIEAFIDVD